MKDRMHKPVKVTRRAFVKAAGMAAAVSFGVPAVVPSSVLGAESKLAPSERIGVAMIGMGRQAYHANLKPFAAQKAATHSRANACPGAPGRK